MNLPGTTYVGPPIDDPETLDRLPGPLRSLLEETNGWVAFEGGLHIRGACKEPLWHSLGHVWVGKQAFHKAYRGIRPGDIPFAQDCVGDQYLLRGKTVLRLSSESGEIEDLEMSLPEFFENAESNSVDFLGMHPLLRIQKEGGKLEPGQLTNVVPPFCVDSEKRSYRPVSALDHLAFLADFSRQSREVPPANR